MGHPAVLPPPTARTPAVANCLPSSVVTREGGRGSWLMFAMRPLLHARHYLPREIAMAPESGLAYEALNIALKSIDEFAERELPDTLLIELDEKDEFPEEIVR